MPLAQSKWVKNTENVWMFRKTEIQTGRRESDRYARPQSRINKAFSSLYDNTVSVTNIIDQLVLNYLKKSFYFGNQHEFSIGNFLHSVVSSIEILLLIN